MSDDWLYYMRIALITLLVYAGLVTWVLSYLRRYSLSFWEGMTRAGMGLFFIASAFATLSALLGWDADLRVTLLVVAAGYTSIGLTMTAIRNEERNQLVSVGNVSTPAKEKS